MQLFERIGSLIQPGAAERWCLSAVKRRFVELVGVIPEVQRVLLERAPGEAPRIWTVIDAPPFDPAPRRRVYDAEAEALRGTVRPVVDFRLVNANEVSGRLEEVLPGDAAVLFHR